MTVTVIDNHSVRTDLLTPGRSVLDVGARGFVFAREMMNRGMNVIALDPDPTIVDQHINGVTLMRLGLVGDEKVTSGTLVMHPDPEARHVALPGDRVRHPVVPVVCTSIRALTDRLGMVEWDLVKLNCEGAEYDILKSWPGPIARQVVVSFHEHTPQRQGKPAINACVERLARWYAVVRHEEDARYGAGMNYWDSLFALKEIA